MGLVTNGTHSSQMEIPNGNFRDFFVNGKRPVFLPYLSNLRTRNGFTDLLFNVCSYYISSREDSSSLAKLQGRVVQSPIKLTQG